MDYRNGSNPSPNKKRKKKERRSYIKSHIPHHPTMGYLGN
jgi:hypothetical protein